MNSAPWQPPAFLHTRQQGELWNAILSYRDIPLARDEWTAAFRFSVADTPGPATPALLIQPDNGPAFIAIIGEFPFASLFGADLDMTDLHELPHALRGRLKEGIVATLWRALPDHGLGAARIVAEGPLKELTGRIGDGVEWLSVAIEEIAPEPVIVTVGAAMASIVSVLDGPLGSAAVDRGLAQILTTEASYTLGSLPVTLSELNRLGPGDVVVLPERPSDLLILRAQGRSHAFRFANETWIYLGREATERYRPAMRPSERTNAMPQESQQGSFKDTIGDFDHGGNSERNMAQGESASEPMLADIGELGVIVDFDLGRMSIPLAQLQAWQPGVVVSLDPPALNTGVEVAIRANGQLVGIGDLVRIDDRIGVRITRFMCAKR